MNKIFLSIIPDNQTNEISTRAFEEWRVEFATFNTPLIDKPNTSISSPTFLDVSRIR